MQRREQFDFNQRIQLRREDNSKKRKSNADAKVYIYHHWYYLSIRENSTSFILQKINTNMNANIVTLKKKVFAWLNAHGIIAIVSAFKDVHKVVRVGHSFKYICICFYQYIFSLPRSPASSGALTGGATDPTASTNTLCRIPVYAFCNKIIFLT